MASITPKGLLIINDKLTSLLFGAVNISDIEFFRYKKRCSLEHLFSCISNAKEFSAKSISTIYNL